MEAFTKLLHLTLDELETLRLIGWFERTWAMRLKIKPIKRLETLEDPMTTPTSSHHVRTRRLPKERSISSTVSLGAITGEDMVAAWTLEEKIGRKYPKIHHSICREGWGRASTMTHEDEGTRRRRRQEGEVEGIVAERASERKWWRQQERWSWKARSKAWGQRDRLRKADETKENVTAHSPNPNPSMCLSSLERENPLFTFDYQAIRFN